MKREIILIGVLFSVFTLIAQDSFKHNKDGFSVEFPAPNVEVSKNLSKYYKEIRGIRYLLYKASDYDMELSDLMSNNKSQQVNEYKVGRENYRVANVYGLFELTLTSDIKKNLNPSSFYNKTVLKGEAAMEGSKKPANTWLFEIDNGVIVLSVMSLRDDNYPDLSTVYPFISSLKLADGYTYDIPINITAANYKYDGPNIGTGFTFASQPQQQSQDQPGAVIQRSESDYQQSSTPLSDVDENIPTAAKENKNTFAVIIGNEDYDNEIKVNYAKNDANTFKKYVVKTLGVPVDQVHYIENATFGKMLGELDWLKSVAKAYAGEAKIIFYYAGHGMPDNETKSAYLLPVDGSASQTRTAIKIDELYGILNNSPVKQSTVFLDACFSGAARDGMLASGRGVTIKPKTSVPTGKLVVFTAVSGDQTAHPYEEKGHGLFTYYLLKKLQETKGDVTYKELGDYINSEVTKRSVVSGKEQSPKVNVGTSIVNEWGGWKFVD